MKRAEALLGTGAPSILAAIGVLRQTGEIVAGQRAGEDVALLGLAPFARAESGLASRLRTLAAQSTLGQKHFASVDWSVVFDWLNRRHEISLAPEQEAAAKMALAEPVAILTGGPGTGKTHTLKAILTLAKVKGLRCLLAAPTGRAAKRMEEATGMPAGTLHRVLELRPGGKAEYGPDNPLPADLVVVDEASMLDALLANQLAKALAKGCQLLLVGDPDQLPSVGAGNVLADLIESGQFPGHPAGADLSAGSRLGDRGQRPADQRGSASPVRRTDAGLLLPQSRNAGPGRRAGRRSGRDAPPLAV